MFNEEKDLIKSINYLTSCLEKALEQEVDIEIISGELQITITKNKRDVKETPNSSDEKLFDELDELHKYITSIPEDVRE